MFTLLNSLMEQTLYSANVSMLIPYCCQYSISFRVNPCSWKLLYGLDFFSGIRLAGAGANCIGVSISSDNPSDSSWLIVVSISIKSLELLQLSPFNLPTKKKQSPLYSSLPKSFSLYVPVFRSK